MNKKLLAIAVGAAVAFPAVALADGPTVYGKMNVTLEQYDDGTDSQFQLDSNNSRLGVKGSYGLDVGGLSAIYQAEFGINVDDGAGPFSQRNIYAGLKGGFGAVMAGKFDTPLKTSQGKIDQFGDLDGDIKSILAGENRVNNIVQYASPKIADSVTINAAFIPGEGNDIDGDGEVEDGVADSTSLSVVFESAGFYAALAQDSDISDDLEADDQGASDTLDITRLVGAYKADAFEVGALYQIASETEGDGEDTTMLVSGAFSIDRVKLKAQYGITEGDQSEEELTTMSLGADYKLAKASKVFAYYTLNEADLAGDEDTFIAVGLEHKF